MANWRRWFWSKDVSEEPVAESHEALRTERDPKRGKPANELAHGASLAEAPDPVDCETVESVSEGPSEGRRTSAEGNNPTADIKGKRERYEDAKRVLLSQAADLFSNVWLPRLLNDFATAPSPPEELLGLALEVLLWEELRDGRMKLVKQKTLSGEGLSARFTELTSSYIKVPTQS